MDTGIIQYLRFDIPDQATAPSLSQNHTQGTKAHPSVTWTCALTKLPGDTVLATLRPPSSAPSSTHVFSHPTQLPCQSIQVLSISLRVLVAKNISRVDLSKRGVEVYLRYEDVFKDTKFQFVVVTSYYPLKHLHPAALRQNRVQASLVQTLDPMIELMTRFLTDKTTANVTFAFSPAAQPYLQLKAHQTILSIYPAFAEKILAGNVTRGNINPHQRIPVIFEEPLERHWGLEEMLKFIYTGMKPSNPDNIDSAGWGVVFDLGKRYQLDLFMDEYLAMLRDSLRFDRLLEVYFAWGHRHARVAMLCADVISKNAQVYFRGQYLGEYMLQELQRMSRQDGSGNREELHQLYDVLLQVL
ncbi:hypothetical protein BGZ94_009087 [Podila epigama]|nr:hypothetical protein BGZ94_009087 [Podila epigama]